MRFSALEQNGFPMDVQFSIKNSYPPTKKNSCKRAWKHWGRQQEQRTHDMGIKVIGNSHVNHLLYF